MRKIVFLFGGQGAHHYQMGKGLYDEDPELRSDMQAMDRLVERHSGQSALSQLYGDVSRTAPFDQTRITHPAIFMLEVGIARYLIRRGIVPDMVMAASLGAFAAAVIGGYIGMEDGLAAVLQQAEAIAEHCPSGSMLAVLGDPAVEYSPLLSSHCDLAGINCPSQFVLSGRKPELDIAAAFLQRRDVPFSQLPVTHPFHSRWLDGARKSCIFHLQALSCRPGHLPMVCCVTCSIVNHIRPEYLWSVARDPVRLLETVRRLEEEGSYTYIDVGPSGSTAGIVKQCLSSSSTSRVTAVLSPWVTRGTRDAELLTRIRGR